MMCVSAVMRAWAVLFLPILMCSTNKVHSALTLRGGSSVTAKSEYHSTSPIESKAATKILFTPTETWMKGQIKKCTVRGSWSKWENDEILTLNSLSGRWETSLLLAPGEYKMKFIVNEQWSCSAQHPTKIDDAGFTNNILIVEGSAFDARNHDDSSTPLNGNVRSQDFVDAEHNISIRSLETNVMNLSTVSDGVTIAACTVNTEKSPEPLLIPAILETETLVADGSETEYITSAFASDSIPMDVGTQTLKGHEEPVIVCEKQLKDIIEMETELQSPLNASDICDAANTTLEISEMVNASETPIEATHQDLTDQEAAVAELQNALDKARTHAKELLCQVAELEKSRASADCCQEVTVNTDDNQPNEKVGWCNSILRLCLQTASKVLGPSCFPTTDLPKNQDVKVSNGTLELGLGANGKESGGWGSEEKLRLRGGQRSQSAQLEQFSISRELDETLKQASAQVQGALDRIEALASSLALLVDSADHRRTM